MNELFFHECRAAGLVFKTSDDWFKWLTDNSYDIKKPVAEHEGFKYNINDVCINPQKVNPITDGNYPLKIDEYLAMGKPVVATRTHTMEDVFASHTHLASSIEES